MVNNLTTKCLFLAGYVAKLCQFEIISISRYTYQCKTQILHQITDLFIIKLVQQIKNIFFLQIG
jgi:hypothetical protein